MKEVIVGGAYLQRETCVSKSIGLALIVEKKFTVFALFYFVFKGNFQVQALEGRFNGGFFALRVWGAYIWKGLYMEGLIFGILRYLYCIYFSLS